MEAVVYLEVVVVKRVEVVFWGAFSEAFALMPQSPQLLYQCTGEFIFIIGRDNTSTASSAYPSLKNAFQVLSSQLSLT